MAEVYITECRTYDESRVKEAMTIGIKANLVSFMKPDAAATTHPTIPKVLCDMINERGAKCIIGDSPGVLYNSVFVGRVYSATGMKICPAKAIVIVRGKPKINRKECIRCFCCQEFYPKGALKVKRPFIAKILSK